jgi:hypothetical protein
LSSSSFSSYRFSLKLKEKKGFAVENKLFFLLLWKEIGSLQEKKYFFIPSTAEPFRLFW